MNQKCHGYLKVCSPATNRIDDDPRCCKQTDNLLMVPLVVEEIRPFPVRRAVVDVSEDDEAYDEHKNQANPETCHRSPEQEYQVVGHVKTPDDADAREVARRKVNEPEHDAHDKCHAERDEVKALQAVGCQVKDGEYRR